MNDQNIPPVPPSYPGQPPQTPQTPGQGTPAYGQPPLQQGYSGQPPYQHRYAAEHVYQQAGPYQQTYAEQPPFGQHPFMPQTYQQPGKELRSSSGYRLASGIVGIALGVWLFFSFLIGVSLVQGPQLILTLIGCFGSIASGIVLVAKQRDRGRGAPITMISVAAASLVFSFVGPVQFLMTFMFALAIFIVMGMGLAREARGL